ncbi:hypothetical protein D9M69_620760 [compost metagenome]
MSTGKHQVNGKTQKHPLPGEPPGQEARSSKDQQPGQQKGQQGHGFADRILPVFRPGQQLPVTGFTVRHHFAQGSDLLPPTGLCAKLFYRFLPEKYFLRGKGVVKAFGKLHLTNASGGPVKMLKK